MRQQKYQIHISEFCDRVYRQHEHKCGTPLEASETTANGGAGNFDDDTAETEFCIAYLSRDSKQRQHIPTVHLDSIAPDDGVYEGFDDKARPMDSVPAYLAERSGIRYQDAIEYIWRAGHGCQWSGLKRVSGEVRRDVTEIAQIVFAHFKGDAMDELVDWFVDLYPKEAAEMDLAAPLSEQPVGKGMSWQEAKKAAERHVKRNNNVFPGVNALARIVGCVPSTMLKAIKNSAYLTARKAEHESDAKKPKEVALTRDVLAITAQQRETDPCDVELARLTKEQADDRVREERQHIKRQHTRTPSD